MQAVTVKATKRNEFGKKANRTLRKDGAIPAVMYGGGDVIHFSTTKKEVKSLIYTPDFKLAEVEIDGATHKALLKEAQFHPVTDEIIHLDFLKLIEGSTIKVQLPIKFTGVSPGVLNGGKLIQSMRKVLVKTTPENLVDVLIVDISKVELGGSVRVREIEPVDGIEMMTDGSIPVAGVEVPRALKSATAAEEEDASAAAPEAAAATE